MFQMTFGRPELISLPASRGVPSCQPSARARVRGFHIFAGQVNGAARGSHGLRLRPAAASGGDPGELRPRRVQSGERHRRTRPAQPGRVPSGVGGETNPSCRGAPSAGDSVRPHCKYGTTCPHSGQD